MNNPLSTPVRADLTPSIFNCNPCVKHQTHRLQLKIDGVKSAQAMMTNNSNMIKMPKSLITLSIIALFTSCGTRGGNNSATHNEGVVINGVRWATRNVDAPGTFAENPESLGMHFQWNRPTGWVASSSLIDWNVIDWNAVGATGVRWYAINDPCPTGWRVPTHEELQLLGQEFSEWTTLNGVNGRLFGIYPYQIFLPAAGWRDGGNSINGTGTNGIYWSRTQSDRHHAWNFGFFNTTIRANNSDDRAFGFSVRCVAK